MEKLETFKNPQQIDEVMVELIAHYLKEEKNKYKNLRNEDLISKWEMLNNLYSQGGPKENF